MKETPPKFLTGGAKSVVELRDAFIRALADTDLAALHSLRLSKDEYLQIIVPGTVAPGQPDREVSEGPKEYFWEVLDAKSRYFGDVLMRRYAGQRYAGVTLRFTEDPRHYSRYNAFGEVRLQLTSDDRATYDLHTGWIAEVAGRYKFIGFEWDD